MSLIKRVSVLLACLIVGGLASAPLAGAANATDAGAPGLPSVENALQGSGSGADSDPAIQQREAELERAISRHNRGSNATTSGASISGPNFGKQRRRCKKVRNNKRKRACLKRVNRRQKRYQRQNRVRKMPFAVAKRETMDFAESAYLELDMDDYNAGNCKRLSRAKVRCIYVVWEDSSMTTATTPTG